MVRLMMISGALCALLTGSCVQRDKTEANIMVGSLKMEDVYRTCPRFRQKLTEYEPDDAVVQRLRDIDRPIRFKVFLGTWCSDSEEQVPPFERLIREAMNPSFTVEYYGVNRNMCDGIRMAKSHNIQYVPTFLLFENETEIGRIVETPTLSIGEDLLHILEGEK